MIGGAVGLTLNNVLTPDQITGWGWRVPFAVGLSVIPASLYLRRTIPDIEEFKAAQIQKATARGHRRP